MEQHADRGRVVAIVGNPNCGKTTIFNELTGLRQKVGNYPGVTVEKKEGIVRDDRGGELTLIDLPGTYSLTANSPDEQIASDALLGKGAHVRKPDGVVCVVDATGLERGLYLVSQIIDQRYPLIIVLNMADAAERAGIRIDIPRLSTMLGVRVIPTVGSKGIGMAELREALRADMRISPAVRKWQLPDAVREEHEELAGLLVRSTHADESVAYHDAAALLSTPRPLDEYHGRIPASVLDHVRQDHERLGGLGFDRHSVFVESRYAWVHSIADRVVASAPAARSMTDRIDAVVTHKVWGIVIFLALMMLMFQSIFTWAEVPMQLIGEGFGRLGGAVGRLIPPGDLHDLLVDGAITGVGAVVTFLPQIMLMFFFMGILEDSGYMARAAFIMNRVMGRVGLHGKAFIPLLSSFACAIPGIMATRTIENSRDRLVTMLVAPLMSCSARLPVYSLLIAAFIPSTLVFGFWNLQGIVMISLFLLGVLAALLVAAVFKRTILRGESPEFILELPPYRWPSFRSIFIQMWSRAKIFLRSAGTIILAVSIVLWFLSTYPKLHHGTPSEKLSYSAIGRAGHVIEPVIRPLGFDWKVGIGILSSLLQREVFVSSISTIYNVQVGADTPHELKVKMQDDRDPVTGLPTFSVLTAIGVLVYYVLAMQCMSTLAVMRRETNGWKWPLIQLVYMNALAYGAAFVVYRVGLMLG